MNKASEIEALIASNYPLLSKNLVVYPKMSNDLILEKIAENNILLLFNDYSIIGTKVYEFIAIQRKIIFCYSDEEKAKTLKSKHFTISEEYQLSNTLQQDLITQKNAGTIVRNEQHLFEVLTDLNTEFLTSGSIRCNSDSVEEFSRKKQTGILVKIIEEISN